MTPFRRTPLHAVALATIAASVMIGRAAAQTAPEPAALQPSGSPNEPSTPAAPGLAAPPTIPAGPPKAESQPPRATTLDPKRAPRPFAGTQLFQQLSTSTATLIRSQQHSYNPTVEASTFLLPRYSFTDWQLRGRLVFNYEITNNDSTVTRNEPRFSDTTLQLFYRRLPTLAGIQPLLGAQIIAPTSPESRARTMYFSPGLVAQLSRPVPHVLGGELLLLAALVYQHPVYGSTTPEVRGGTPYGFACYGGGNGCDGQLSGVTNASDIVSWTALVAGEWGKWSPAILVLGTHQFTYAPRSISAVELQSDGANVRQSTYFSAWIDYNVNAWFTAEVGYFMFRNVLSGGGHYGNPFFDRYQDARLYLGFNLNVDNLVKELVGKDEGDEAGVIRARNRFAPPAAAF